MINTNFLQSFRENFKNGLNRLPLGIGRMMILPLIRKLASLVRALSIKNIRRKYDIYRKRKIEKQEAKSILNALENKSIDRVSVVFDNSTSPPAYGEYFKVVMLGRYFLSHEVYVNFFIVDSASYRDVEGRPLNTDEKETFLKDQLNIAKAYLPESVSRVKLCKWNDVFIQMTSKENNDYFVFLKKILAKEPIYPLCFNLMNHLFEKSKSTNIDRFLINKNNLEPELLKSCPSKPYITFHCRYCTIRREDRNTKDSEFIETVVELNKYFPDHSVLMISDFNGCKYFRKVAKENNLACSFSKDFSNSFLGDILLLQNSDFYFQYQSGGIIAFAIYSKLPYVICTALSHEDMYSFSSLVPWQNSNQVFMPLKWHDQSNNVADGLTKIPTVLTVKNTTVPTFERRSVVSVSKFRN
ncbi:MAG: hypothetical protein P9L94_09365 [Candidatus Hinthialibacter antarcticus]|nr:hypothetical protein [Candidatus Hinthialibacter antarcticus]